MSNFELSGSQSYVTKEQIIPPSIPVGEFWVKFWGVRGLIPTPCTNTHRYGGNTACIEIYVAGKRLIFDGGTGLRILGRTWQKLHQRLEAHLFFTNSQSSHIQGFPFFAPAFLTDNCFHIYGTAASNGASIKQCLGDQMLQPLFPYPLQAMQSQLHFYNLSEGSVVKLDDVTITTALINQNQRSVGYRVTDQKCSVAYVTDLHKNLDKVERDRILQIIHDADLLIANATYNPPTAYNHAATDVHWKTAVELAKSAGVKQLVISQHHPDDKDDFLDKVQLEIQSIFPKALLACEGLVLSVE
ncbi:MULTISPECIES: MBL fold metallo-hydrolase [unclassified Nodularia (in: cyanobacteria)]|uniref:MBL fold metallo-hydrolase n=1 Tax=unclassified Nodularia (in: cyanobacteria) TaxID=2656917 RepID=UPI001881F961|nr:MULTISPECIES: MBL fold metallo-hydrolase [unclassified Nodularia (in: cyanobacteria)]MBE9197824.1 MBL fold metallo-hydrolase [Nodularia sp. LEGE 06071]MCC2695497.1 MBL fold metallo-hydrolase [Nodularia sp. LEGE 04288]